MSAGDALIVVGAVLIVLGVVLIASGLRRRPPVTPPFVLDLRERTPVIDLTEVGQVWTVMPASSSRRVR